MKFILSLFSFLLVCSLSAQDISTGLVMYYPLDGNLTDSISGETAVNNGNLTFAEGRVDSAVRFFDQGAYFVTPRGKLQVGPAADSGSAGTFSLFVNHRAAPLETDRQNYIAQKNGCGPDDNNRGRVVLYRQNPNNATDPDSLISFVTGRPLRTNYKLDSADTWIHLCLTIDPEIREWAFFVDGIETRRDTFTGTTQAENSCGEFVIGHHLTFTNENQTFDGLMDELRFYNRVLNQAEIDLLASGATVSINEIVSNSLTIGPNPVSTNQPINIEIDRSVFRPGSNLLVNITDLNGRIVLERQYNVLREQIRLEHGLSPGVYLVSLRNGQQLATKKLVVW